MSDQLELEPAIASATGATAPSFTIEVGALLKALNVAKAATERSGGVPILENALFVLTDGWMSITCTNVEIAITKVISANVRVPGSLTVSAGKLADLLAKLSASGIVDAVAGDDSLVVKCGKSKITLPTKPVDEFPRITLGRIDHSASISGSVLAGTLGTVQLAVAANDQRYYLNGMFFKPKDGGAALVGTDGTQIITSEISFTEGSIGDMIVPRKTIGVIIQNITNDTGVVKIEMSATAIRVTMGDTVISSKLVDASYPDCDRVLAKAVVVETPLRIMKDALRRAISLCGSASDAYKDAPVRFVVSSDGVTVVNPTPPAEKDQNLAQTELEAGEYEYGGSPVEVALGSKQLDAVASVAVGDVVLHITHDAHSVRVEDTGNPAFLGMLQTFRV